MMLPGRGYPPGMVQMVPGPNGQMVPAGYPPHMMYGPGGYPPGMMMQPGMQQPGGPPGTLSQPTLALRDARY
eukprot:1950061-Rhodomonas_salina.4